MRQELGLTGSGAACRSIRLSSHSNACWISRDGKPAASSSVWMD
jgi:hypothetical protein